MIDYIFGEPGSERGDVWSRSMLAPLAPDALTPFTASLLVEVAARAWFLYFDRLGFSPTPRSRIVRVHAGRPYVNLSISAVLDAEHAGIEPPVLNLDGVERPVTAWEKPGLFAGMRLGRGARKIEETLSALGQDLPQITAKAAAWHARVSALRWSQAEVLQIMEEIERVGSAALLPYFAARHALEGACRRLWRMLGAQPAAARAALIAGALGGAERTVEVEMARRVQALGGMAAAAPAVLAWLDRADFSEWGQTAPDGSFAENVAAFMHDYGHRGLQEGEIASPRWYESPTLFFVAVRAAADSTSARAGAAPPAALDALLAALDARQRKEAQRLVEQMRLLVELQSSSLHAFSFILAGTRRWALAAGREAMADHRLTNLEDVFFYEVEEVKEMMTGEWNISDRSTIHATADERRAVLARQRGSEPGSLFWGDREARDAAAGLPASAGASKGAVAAAGDPARMAGGCILACRQPESAAAVLLPASSAFFTAQGSLIDPLAVCARTLGRPGVVALGGTFAEFLSSPTVLVDGNQGRVTAV